MKGKHGEPELCQRADQNRQLRAYLEQQTPQTPEDLESAVQGLADWDKPVWVAAAIGAVAAAFSEERPIDPRVMRAIDVAEQWVRCPCDAHAVRAEAAQFDPKPLWGNCNDRWHITKLAANRVARAASGYGRIDDAVGAARIMAHPLVFAAPELYVWQSIVRYVRAMVLDQC